MSSAIAEQNRAVLAQASRLGARYRPSWPLAVLLVALILVATASSLALANVLTAILGPDGELIDGSVGLDQMRLVGAAMVAVYGLALFTWSLWIALVVANVPALTARWPRNGAVGAFLAAWIPFINLVRPYTIVRDVLALLAGGRIAPSFIALVWWVSVLAMYILPGIIAAARAAELGPIPAAALALEVQFVLLVPTAILAIAVVVIVEREQRAALARRKVAVLGAEAAAA
jgi:hypothetical protein